MGKTMAVETTVTKNNAIEVFERLIVGNIRAQNYNSDCFGMSDLRHADRMAHAMDQFITKVIEAGYCQHAILGKTLKEYGYWLQNEPNPALKKELDDDFSIDMSEFQFAIATGYQVYEDTIDSINKGFMKYR